MKHTRQERRILLQEKLREDPFLTDWQLADEFNVSVATIRLDRMALNIPELRVRARTIASSTYAEVRALQGDEVIGELVDLSLGERATSVLEITDQMVFERNQIVRGHFLFAQGNSLAVAVVNSDLALTKSANVRFYQPVKLGDRVVAKASVQNISDNRYVIHVDSKVQEETVYRGEYTIVDVAGKGGVADD